jgi:nitrogen fixation/metabolism regulation signal transduction histidine kinase
MSFESRAMMPRNRATTGLQLPLWVGAVGAAAFALGFLSAATSSVAMLACAGLAAAGALLLTVVRLQQKASHPLRTAANVLDALRHGDYMQRARTDVIGGPASDLLAEVNQLAQHLQAERVRAAETAALLQAVVQRVDVALLTFDDAGVLRWWNPAAERLFQPRLRDGLSAEELGAAELLSGPIERSVSLPGVVLPSGVAATGWQLRRGVFHRAGQRYQFVLLSSVQRVRREEERAAWQRLLRVLGHEVNNTLTPIQSLAATCREMLAEEGAPAVPEVLSALSVMEHRARGLGQFISEFARLARLPEPRLERLELGAHVRRVVPLDARCPVHVVGTQSVELFADGPLLEQALLNLIRNAVDASVPRQGAVTIDWQADADSAVLSISDEGDGVANPDNLFVPLFTTKPGGSGIGLVLARNIVEAHGGQLRLDNKGQAPGCIARVTLPRAPRPDPSEPAPLGASAP